MALSDDLRDWLAAAIRDEEGKDRITLVTLAEQSGVSRATIYRMLEGKGEADQATIDRLAAALGVPAPQVEKRLRHAAAVQRPAPSALALLREAKERLERVEAMLERERAAATSSAEAEAERILEEERSVIEPAKEETRRQRPRGSRRAGGSGR